MRKRGKKFKGAAMTREFYSEIELKIGDKFLYLQFDPDAEDEEFILISYYDNPSGGEDIIHELQCSMEMIEGLYKAARKLKAQ